MNPDLLKDPKVLIIGGVGIVAVFLLMKNGGGSSSPAASTGSSTDASQATTPVGGSYSYLDGMGTQHLIATDPNNGALTGYGTPSLTDPGNWASPTGTSLTTASDSPVTGLNSGGGFWTGLSAGDFQAGHVPLAFYNPTNPYGSTTSPGLSSPVDPGNIVLPPSVNQLSGPLMGGGSGVVARPIPGWMYPTFNPA